jgi:hypothetical protein
LREEEYGGPIDIVIYAYTPSMMPVLYIVEAKKNDIDQGRAQLYPQLKVCYEQAQRKENWEKPIFGAISTVDKWVFVKYNGKRWIESEPFLISTYHDRNGIQRVAEALFKIIRQQNDLVEDIVAKYAPQED